MRTETKYRLLLTFSFLCLIGFAGQTLQLWKINDQLAQLNPETKEIPESIEQRIVAELDKKATSLARRPGMSAPSPFGNLQQIEDYMDSMFAGFGSPFFPSNSLLSRNSFSFSSAVPEIAVDETEKDYQILVPVKPEQEIELSTNIEDNAVSISGVVTENLQQSQNNFAGSYLSQRQFDKTLKLPTPIDQFGMTTEQTDGGIRITIPKKTG